MINSWMAITSLNITPGKQILTTTFIYIIHKYPLLTIISYGLHESNYGEYNMNI